MLTVRRTLHGNSTVRPETVDRDVNEVDVDPIEAKVRFVKTGFIYPSFIEVVNRVQECGRYYAN